MKHSKFIRRKKYKLTWLVLALVLVVLGACFDQTNGRKITRQTSVRKIQDNVKLAVDQTDPITKMWLEGAEVNSVRENELLLNLKKWRKLGVAIYLYENGQNKLWSNDYVDPDLRELVPTTEPDSIVTVDGKKILLFKKINPLNKREAIIALELADTNSTNKAIFYNQNIKIKTANPDNNPQFEKIDCLGKQFWCTKSYHITPHYCANIIGWTGAAIMLILLVTLMLKYTNRKNVILLVFICAAALAIIRGAAAFAPYQFLCGVLEQNYHNHIFQILFAPKNIVFNSVVLLMFSFYSYAVRCKLKKRIELSKKYLQKIMYAAILIWRTATILYTHLAIVVNAELLKTNPNIVNEDYKIQLGSLVVYGAMALLFISIYFQSHLFLLPKKRKFIIADITVSLVMIIAFTLTFYDMLHGTWVLIPLFFVSFRALAFMNAKYSTQTIFTLSIILFAIYISATGAMMQYKTNNVVTYNTNLTLKQQKLKKVFYEESANWSKDTTLLLNKKDFDLNVKKGEIAISYIPNSTLAFRLMAQISVVFFLIALISIPIFWIMGIPTILWWEPKKRSLVQKVQLLVLGGIVVSFASTVLLDVVNARKTEVKVRGTIVMGLVRVVQNNIHSYSANADTLSKSILKDWFNWHGAEMISSNLALFDKNGQKIIAEPSNKFARNMNFNAFNKLNIYNAALYSYEDGEDYQVFFPAYSKPKSHSKKELVGYVNIKIANTRAIVDSTPYMYDMISLLFIAMFVLVCVSWLIYRIVALPIGIFQKALARPNEISPIPYNKIISENSEIRALAQQYNKVVKYVEEYAQVAVNAQREKLWHDVAKEMAHEIKNPLTPMMLKIQMLQQYKLKHGDMPEEKVEQTLNLILEQIGVINEYVDDFRKVASMNIENVQVINLVSVVERTVTLYSDLENPGAVVEFTIDGNKPTKEIADAWVIADNKQLMRAISNLLKNATQAVNNVEFPSVKVDLRITSANKMAYITVSDNGEGVPDEIAKKMFERSFTTKQKGLGIGLAVASKIVENLKGDISFYNNEGAGATFIIRLPLFQG